jgi:hypothetical protein
MDFRVYKKVVALLKEKCPPAYPVDVRRVKLDGFDGECTLHNKRFYIRINKDLSENSAIDCVLHEWAHARAWNHLHDALDEEQFAQRSHDASWGVAYSEVYRTYEAYHLLKKDHS